MASTANSIARMGQAAVCGGWVCGACRAAPVKSAVKSPGRPGRVRLAAVRVLPQLCVCYQTNAQYFVCMVQLRLRFTCVEWEKDGLGGGDTPVK